MRARNLLSLAAGVCLLVIVLAGAPSHGAVARESSLLGVSIPTETDFYIQDWLLKAPGEMNADVTYNSDDDEYLVVFDWDFDDTGNRDVMFVVVSGGGGVSPGPFDVAADPAWDDSNPAVAYNPDEGNYMVVWERRDASNVGQIFGTIVTDGTPGSIIQIKAANADHLNPDVAYSTGAGRYLVVWEDHGAGWMPPPDIEGASYNGTGGDAMYLHIAPDLVDQPGAQTDPAVAAHGTLARWLVVWEDSRPEATFGNDVWGQQVAYDSGSNALSLVPPSVAVGTAPGGADAPDVAWAQTGGPGGEYLVVWIERDLAELVLARRIDSTTALLGDMVLVSNHEGSGKFDPGVVFATNSNAWWTVWADNREYG